MSHPTNEHPSREILAAFADGRSTGYDLQALDAHIASCDLCVAALAQLSRDTTLSERLRVAVAGDPALLDSLNPVTQSIGDLQPYLQPSPRPDSPGRFGHYDIVQVLGRGGFGIVVKAFDPALQRLVALKVLAPQLATEAANRQRFLREARSAAAVLHENVVHIYYVHEDPLPHIVLELVSGENLQDRLDRHGMLAPAVAIPIARQIAAGMAAAHGKGLIHRDIKPANILLDGTVQPRVKLTDFGLARTVEDSHLTQSGLIAGTPRFMSPEQARGDTLDSRSDLFGLGSVLYLMLSGRVPFDGPNAMVILKRICDDVPGPLIELVPDAPRELCTLIERLLEKDPARRIQTADEVAARLQDLERTTALPGLSGLATNQLSPVGASTATGPADLTHPMTPEIPRPQPARGWVAAGLALIVIAAVLLTLPGQPKPLETAALKPDPSTKQSVQAPSSPPHVQPATQSKEPSKAPTLPPKTPPQPPVPTAPMTDLPLDIRGFPADLVEHPMISAKWEWGLPENLGRAIYPDGPIHDPFVTGDEKTLVFRNNVTTFLATRNTPDEPFGPPVKIEEHLAQIFPIISRDRLTLTFCTIKLPSAGGGFDLWESHRDSADAKFGPPRDLGPPVNGPHSDGQLCYSADGLTVIFASSRPGGLGSDDFWQAKRPALDQPFSEPVWLGAEFNYDNQDFTPQLTAQDRILLFASGRPGTFGRFDIWMCVRATPDAHFCKPINLGNSVNTHMSEGRPSLSDDGQTLYFDSDRPGGNERSDFWCIRRVLKKQK